MKRLIYSLLAVIVCFCCLSVKLSALEVDSPEKPIDVSEYAVLVLDETIHPQFTLNGCTITPTITIQGNYTLEGTTYTGVNATATQTSVSYTYTSGGAHTSSCTMTNYYTYISNNHVVIYMFFDLTVDGVYQHTYMPYILV
ncbi:MAG: hypothetical protein E7186_03040 [Erysipelotrichaceae bacterium]|nr:hypothetical protein [Erysipelotrichaceae bacterium]